MTAGPMPLERLPKRLHEKIEVTSSCWIWRGHVTPQGYGGAGGIPAHRRVYEVLIGPIPEGLELDHLCRVRLCVNPTHLEPVTPYENWRRSENPTARNARKTHCKRGHPFDEANTYWWGGHRQCRACRDDIERRRVRPWRRR